MEFSTYDMPEVEFKKYTKPVLLLGNGKTVERGL